MRKVIQRNWYWYLALLGTLFLAGHAPFSQAQARKTSADKVKLEVTSTRPAADGHQRLVLRLKIDKGWYIYANPVGNEDFAGNETRVTVTGAVKPTDVKTTYPAGKPYDNACHIYENEVTLVSDVYRAPGDTSPLTLTLHVNACSKETMVCLLPGQIKQTVPATIPK